jgi:hypothetical protein
MSGALTLVVFVAGAEPDGDVATSLARAAREALGADTRIDLRSGSPTDDEALAEEQRRRATAVVELSFADPKHRAGKLRVHVSQSGRWLERSIGFGTTDAEAERGRTLGFAAASMLPEAGAATPTESSAPSPSPAPETSGPPRVAHVPEGNGNHETVARTPEASGNHETMAEAPSPPQTATPARPPSPERPSPEGGKHLPTVTLDIVGLASTGVGGSFDGFGGGLAGQYFVGTVFALRLGGGVLSGTVPEAAATTLSVLGSAGLTLAPFRTAPGRPFGFAAHVDYALIYESMTHFSTNAPSTTLARWQSGVQAMAEVEWLLPSLVGFVGGVGVQDVLSPTYVEVRNVQVANLPEVRLLAEIGVRARF